MKNTILAIYAVMTLFTAQNSQAQVQVNIRLHPVVELTVDDKQVVCQTQGKDLYVTYPLETFIVPHGEILRFELLGMDETKSYTLFYNNQTKAILTRNKPYFIAHPERGSRVHKMTLKITQTRIASCRDIVESTLLQLEPM